LVFAAGSSDNGFQEMLRKLGIKYCYNRPCALYAAPGLFREEAEKASSEYTNPVNLKILGETYF
jgi:acylaminoacyl-peptidase